MNATARLATRGGALLAAALSTEALVAILWPAPELLSFDASCTVGSGSPTLRVSVVGDSSCTGPGVDRPDQIWVREVAHRLALHLDCTVDLVSFAIGGARSGDVVASQLEAAVASRPHLAMVSVGANDVLKAVPLGVFAHNLDRIVAALTSTGAEVVLSGVGDLGTIPRLLPPLRQLVARRARRADHIHDRIAVRHGVVKASQWGWARGQFRTRPEVWSPDKLHPNAEGHAVWADSAWGAVASMTESLGAVVRPASTVILPHRRRSGH